MKFFATLAVASALAMASAQDACSPTLITVATTSPEAQACAASTGFQATAALQTFPDADALKKICVDANCQKLLKAVTDAVPTECVIGPVKVKAQLVDKFAAACGNASGKVDGKAGSGSKGSAAEIKTPTPNKSTAGSSDKAASTTAGSGASSTPAASATKAVPTPTPAPTKSSASTVAAATGAVVMAVAATML